MQLEGGLAILRDGDAGKSPGLVEGLPAQERRRAAEERAVPLVEPGLGHRVEHLVLGRHPLEGLEVPLDRIGIQEGVRGLDQEELRVLGKVADGLGQQRAERHVVGVEHQHQIAGGGGQTVVEVAGLGVLVAGPRQVARVEVTAERLQFGPPGLRGRGLLEVRVGAFLVGAAVVEEPDGQLLGRVVHLACGGQRHRQDLGILVVARHEDVDERQVGRRHGGGRAATQGLGVDDQADEQDEDAVEFAQQQQQAEAEADRIARRGQRIGHPPQDVAEHHQAAHRQEDEARPRPVEGEPEHGHRRHGGEAHRELVLGADGLAQEGEAGGRRPHPGQPSQRTHHAHRSRIAEEPLRHQIMSVCRCTKLFFPRRTS